MTRDWQQSLVVHAVLVGGFVFLARATPLQTTREKVPIEVFQVPVEASQPLNLQPPKAEPVPPPPVAQAKPVFGLNNKALVAQDTAPAGTDTVEVKSGNTLAVAQDTIKMDPNQADPLPLPTDEFLVSKMPVLITDVKIPYPVQAKRAGVQGPVVLELLIDREGKVRQAVIVSGPGQGLNEAALEAAQLFRFQPAKVDDQPVAVKIRYTYRFVLEAR